MFRDCWLMTEILLKEIWHHTVHKENKKRF